jgi:hypothetical protein
MRCGADGRGATPPSTSTPRCPHRHGIEPAEAVGSVGAVVTFSPLLRLVSHKGGRLVLRRGADGHGATPPSTPTPLVAHTAIELLTIRTIRSKIDHN